jgi:hypothetical protein
MSQRGLFFIRAVAVKRFQANSKGSILSANSGTPSARSWIRCSKPTTPTFRLSVQNCVRDRKSLFLEYLASGEERPSFLACKRLDVPGAE